MELFRCVPLSTEFVSNLVFKNLSKESLCAYLEIENFKTERQAIGILFKEFYKEIVVKKHEHSIHFYLAIDATKILDFCKKELAKIDLFSYTQTILLDMF